MSNHVELIALTEQHLAMVLTWRNTPAVRQNMYTSHEISFTEHQQWFLTLKEDSSKAYFVMMINDIPSGVIGFSEINTVPGIATWAFYSSPSAQRGCGSLMEFYALEYAFDTLGLHKLRCEVLGFNQTVVRLHKKFGFKVEGQHRDAFFDGKQYQDIVHLGMLKSEWTEQRPIMKQKLRLSL